MMITRFPTRASGPAERLAGFMAHLRGNGFTLGPQETAQALEALHQVDIRDMFEVRLALRAMLVPDAEGWRRFDDLFDAYWFNAGKQKMGQAKSDHVKVQAQKPMLWQDHFGETRDAAEGVEDAPMTADPEGEDAAEGTDGQLIATRQDNLSKRDLRELMDEDSLRRAEEAAERLGKALRDKRSRRRKQARKGPGLDLRRILRGSLASGGDPLRLFHRKRPLRPLRVVALCDVSGSMTVYARVFLAFLKGLIGSDTQAEAYLFHTRLLRVTDTLRDHDSLRAAGRLSLMAEGFGGGTDISGCLRSFLQHHAGRVLNGRTVVLILSDGYCTSSPQDLGSVLARIKRRSRRIVWLNPLKGWQGYEPVAAAMQEALPHLDAHLPANTIEALAALEPEFARL